MCASRGRPERLSRMIESVRRTSTKADVVVCLDDDDAHNYDLATIGVPFIVGPRVGQCASLNELGWKFGGEYEAMGAATDDCEFQTPGWDDWVLEKTNSFYGRVGALGPFCEGVDRMDFPWFTKRWVEVAGAFCPVPTEHFYWDVALEWVGEMTQIAFATKDDFHISHEGVMPLPESPSETPSDYQLRMVRAHTDARTAMSWLALKRRDLALSLNKASMEG